MPSLSPSMLPPVVRTGSSAPRRTVRALLPGALLPSVLLISGLALPGLAPQALAQVK